MNAKPVTHEADLLSTVCTEQFEKEQEDEHFHDTSSKAGFDLAI